MPNFGNGMRTLFWDGCDFSEFAFMVFLKHHLSILGVEFGACEGTEFLQKLGPRFRLICSSFEFVEEVLAGECAWNCHFTFSVAFADFHVFFSFACVLPLCSMVVFSCGRVLSEMHLKKYGKHEVRWIREGTTFCVCGVH